MKNKYPKHIYDPIRQKIVISYIQHEFRKLFLTAPKDYWGILDKDIAGWVNSPELATPRDFWNGFHGICMGFKLKIGMIYYVTAKNIKWERKEIPIGEVFFGVDFPQTRLIDEGKLSAKQVRSFYSEKGREQLKKDWLDQISKLSGNTVDREGQPMIIVQKRQGNEIVFSVYDGNRRLAKAILENREKVEAFVGTFVSGDKPVNYWIPTTILMENLYFARNAFESRDKPIFESYMKVLSDMLEKSESAIYEMKERAITHQQPFRDEVVKALGLKI
jgi:hypothetical protein